MAVSLCNFGVLKLQLGDRDGARELIEESIAMLRSFHPEDHHLVQGVLEWLARCR